jgi:hypothetical protein
MWRWFADEAHLSTEHTFLVLVDLPDAGRIDLPSLGSLFSEARRLAEAWNHPNIRLIHVFAGYWDHEGLKQHFREIVTSFPYTPGENYAVWTGISPHDMTLLVSRNLATQTASTYGEAMFELTGGHPAAALDILGKVESDDISVHELLSATHRAAKSGPAGEALLDAWLQLPSESRHVLKRLILQRQVPIRSLGDRWEQLVTAGAVRHHRVRQEHYVTFQSWYAELLTRLHAEELGIADSGTQSIRTNELIPPVSSLNFQAYRLINDMENQVRNFVATQVCLRLWDDHILKGRAQRLDGVTHSWEDAYDRASTWCADSIDRGVLNPLTAYLSTRDLARLIKEISREMGSEAWQDIAKAIMELSDIRDAVIHNQLIEGSALQRLRELRADIYEALDEC